MQGAEIEDEWSILTYMTKSEIEGQRSSLLIMTQRRYLRDLWLSTKVLLFYLKLLLSGKL